MPTTVAPSAGFSVPSGVGVLFAQDDFSDAQTDTWASADVGGSWSLSGAAASNFDKAGGVGTHTHATSGGTREAILTSVSCLDSESTASFSFDKVPNGGSLRGYLVFRRQSATQCYFLRLRIQPADVYIQASYLNTTETTFGTAFQLGSAAYTAGAKIWVKARVTGTSPTRIQGKVWYDGDPEPSTWQLDASDSTQTALQAAGSVGLRSFTAATATNTPFVISADDYDVRLPPTLPGDATSTAPTATFTVPTPTISTSGGGGSPGAIAQDDFSDTVAGGWANADVGGAWTTSGGFGGTVAGSVNKAGGVGTMALAAGNYLRSAVLSGVSSLSVEATATVSFSSVPVGGSSRAYVVVRRQGTNDYRLRIRLQPGDVFLSVSNNLADLEGPALGPVQIGTGAYVPNSPIRVRFRVTGASPTRLQAKAWYASTAEPAAWQVDVTDSTAGIQTAGAVGLWAYTTSAATNGTTVTWDDFLVEPPGSTVVTSAPSVTFLSGNPELERVPILGVSPAELAAIASRVNAPGSNIWKDHWNDFVANGLAESIGGHRGQSTAQRQMAATTFEPVPIPDVTGALANTNPSVYASAFEPGGNLWQDMLAAWTLALRWKITGNTAYADRAVYVLDQWSTVCQQISVTNPANQNNKLYAAWAAVYGTRAVSVLWSYSGFQAIKPDVQDWFLRVFYRADPLVPSSYNWVRFGSQWSNVLLDMPYTQNWIAGALAARFGIGVIYGGPVGTAIINATLQAYRQLMPSMVYYTGDSHYLLGPGWPKESWQDGNQSTSAKMSEYWFYGSVALAQGQFIDGQQQEHGRDIGHAQMGMGLLAGFAQDVWANGYGDAFNDPGIPNCLERWRATAELSAGWMNETLDQYWNNQGLYPNGLDHPSLTSGDVNSSSWTPAGGPTYGGTPSWSSRNMGTSNLDSFLSTARPWGPQASDIDLGGYSADYGWWAMRKNLKDRLGLSVPQLDRLADRLQGVSSTSSTSRAGLNGVQRGAPVRYANGNALEPVIWNTALELGPNREAFPSAALVVATVAPPTVTSSTSVTTSAPTVTVAAGSSAGTAGSVVTTSAPVVTVTVPTPARSAGSGATVFVDSVLVAVSTGAAVSSASGPSSASGEVITTAPAVLVSVPAAVTSRRTVRAAAPRVKSGLPFRWRDPGSVQLSLSRSRRPAGFVSPVESPSSPSTPTPSVGVSDHGQLDGLSDDDHPQYLTAERAAGLLVPRNELGEAGLLDVGTTAGTVAAGDDPRFGGGGVSDHGDLSGLGDDDHSQYHTDARGDARYARRSNNLSDLSSVSSARSNLGLGSAALEAASAFAGANFGGVAIADWSVRRFDTGGSFPAAELFPGASVSAWETAGGPAVWAVPTDEGPQVICYADAIDSTKCGVYIYTPTVSFVRASWADSTAELHRLLVSSKLHRNHTDQSEVTQTSFGWIPNLLLFSSPDPSQPIGTATWDFVAFTDLVTLQIFFDFLVAMTGLGWTPDGGDWPGGTPANYGAAINDLADRLLSHTHAYLTESQVQARAFLRC